MFCRTKREQDLDCGFRAHLELEALEQQNSGLTEESGRYAARRAFGDITLIKDEANSTCAKRL